MLVSCFTRDCSTPKKPVYVYHSTSIVSTNVINCGVRTIDKSEAPKKFKRCDLRSVSMPFLLFCSAVNTSSGSDFVICRSEPILLQMCCTPGFSSLCNNEALYFVLRVMVDLRFLWEKERERERAKTRMRMQTMR